MDKPPDLGINAQENVKTQDQAFGPGSALWSEMQKQVSGTFRCTDENPETRKSLVDSLWAISKNGGKTIVIQVVAPSVPETMRQAAGTLHCVEEEKRHFIMDRAWEMSEQMKQPVVIVMRAPRSV